MGLFGVSAGVLRAPCKGSRKTCFLRGSLSALSFPKLPGDVKDLTSSRNYYTCATLRVPDTKRKSTLTYFWNSHRAPGFSLSFLFLDSKVGSVVTKVRVGFLLCLSPDSDGSGGRKALNESDAVYRGA